MVSVAVDSDTPSSPDGSSGYRPVTAWSESATAGDADRTAARAATSDPDAGYVDAGNVSTYQPAAGDAKVHTSAASGIGVVTGQQPSQEWGTGAKAQSYATQPASITSPGATDPDGKPFIDANQAKAFSQADAVRQIQALQSPQTAQDVKVPLAFLPPDPSLKMSSQQEQQLEGLAQDFVNAVGGLNQNASDPSYAQRWISAQNLSDQRYEAMFGIDAFNRQQILQSQEAMNNSSPRR